MSHERLAYMANRISRFLESQKPETAVAGIDDHLLKFRDPRMRGTMVAQLAQGQIQPQTGAH